MAANNINYEPSARSGSFCSHVEGKTYLWGGFNKDVFERKTSLQEFTASVYTFDPYLETWATLNPGQGHGMVPVQLQATTSTPMAAGIWQQVVMMAAFTVWTPGH